MISQEAYAHGVTTGRTPFLENVRRHKLVSGRHRHGDDAVVHLSAVSGPADDQPASAGDVASEAAGYRVAAAVQSTGDDAEPRRTPRWSRRFARPSRHLKPKNRTKTYLVVHVARRRHPRRSRNGEDGTAGRHRRTRGRAVRIQARSQHSCRTGPRQAGDPWRIRRKAGPVRTTAEVRRRREDRCGPPTHQVRPGHRQVRLPGRLRLPPT